MLPRKASRSRSSCVAWIKGFNEAAALLPRKAASAREVAVGTNVASMRPRHCCRGRQRSLERVPVRLGGFNEAAALLPRKANCRRGNSSSTATRRFNEAAALLPRKAGVWVNSGEGFVLGFNEAAALLPRKAGARRRAWVGQPRLQ